MCLIEIFMFFFMTEIFLFQNVTLKYLKVLIFLIIVGVMKLKT